MKLGELILQHLQPKDIKDRTAFVLLSIKAENRPHELTPYEAFTIAFLIEQMLQKYRLIGRGAHVQISFLANLKLKILDNLKD